MAPMWLGQPQCYQLLKWTEFHFISIIQIHPKNKRMHWWARAGSWKQKHRQIIIFSKTFYFLTNISLFWTVDVQMFFVSENKNSLNGSIIQKKTNFTKDLDTHHCHTPAHQKFLQIQFILHIFGVVLKDDYLKKTSTASHCSALTAP